VALQRRYAIERRAGDLRNRTEQYLAVQTSGRHLHPVKYDNLQHSSRCSSSRSTKIRDRGAAESTPAPLLHIQAAVGFNPAAVSRNADSRVSPQFIVATNCEAARKKRNREVKTMSHRIRKLGHPCCTALASASMLALTASAPQAQYKLTVNRSGLLNAANEPQTGS